MPSAAHERKLLEAPANLLDEPPTQEHKSDALLKGRA